MRRKVSTLLDEHVFRRTRLEAARQGRQISAIVGEALNRYLAQTSGRPASLQVVAETWGVLSVKRSMLRRVVREEPGVLEREA